MNEIEVKLDWSVRVFKPATSKDVWYIAKEDEPTLSPVLAKVECGRVKGSVIARPNRYVKGYVVSIQLPSKGGEPCQVFPVGGCKSWTEWDVERITTAICAAARRLHQTLENLACPVVTVPPCPVKNEATISKDKVAVRHSVRIDVDREYLTFSVPNGWADVQPLVGKVLEYDGRDFKFSGWNSDRNECFFYRMLTVEPGIARWK